MRSARTRAPAGRTPRTARDKSRRAARPVRAARRDGSRRRPRPRVIARSRSRVGELERPHSRANARARRRRRRRRPRPTTPAGARGRSSSTGTTAADAARRRELRCDGRAARRTRRVRAIPRGGRRARPVRSTARRVRTPARSRDRVWRRSTSAAPLRHCATRARRRRQGTRPPTWSTAASGARPGDTDHRPSPVEQAERDRRTPRARARSGRGCVVVPPWVAAMLLPSRRDALPASRRPRPAPARRRARARARTRAPTCAGAESSAPACRRDVVVEQDVDVERARPPAFDRARGPRRARARCASASSSSGRARCRPRRRRSGTRPAAVRRRAAVSYTRETAIDGDAAASAKPVDRGLQDTRGGRRGSNRATRYGVRFTARRGRRRGRASTRTGGCILRTSTTTPDDTRIGTAHLGDPRREPLEQAGSCSDETMRAHGFAHRAVVDRVVELVALAGGGEVDEQLESTSNGCGRACSSGSTPCTPSSRSPR